MFTTTTKALVTALSGFVSYAANDGLKRVNLAMQNHFPTISNNSQDNDIIYNWIALGSAAATTFLALALMSLRHSKPAAHSGSEAKDIEAGGSVPTSAATQTPKPENKSPLRANALMQSSAPTDAKTPLLEQPSRTPLQPH